MEYFVICAKASQRWGRVTDKERYREKYSLTIGQEYCDLLEDKIFMSEGNDL